MLMSGISRKTTGERTANFLKLLLGRDTWLASYRENSCENARCKRLERLRRLIYRHGRDDMRDGFVYDYLIVLREVCPNVGSESMQL
jgi:hypothetical protein